MAIKLRLLGTVTDAVRGLTYTRSGVPRLSFGVRVVGTRRSRHYLITAYGTMARFCDIYLRTGQRVTVEGAYLRRYPAFEGLVRADTIRHVGSTFPPFPGTMVSFVPARPPITESAGAARPIPREQVGSAVPSRDSAAVDDAITSAVN